MGNFCLFPRDFSENVSTPIIPSDLFSPRIICVFPCLTYISNGYTLFQIVSIFRSNSFCVTSHSSPTFTEMRTLGLAKKRFLHLTHI